jgi:hypothetical protein
MNLIVKYNGLSFFMNLFRRQTVQILSVILLAKLQITLFQDDLLKDLNDLQKNCENIIKILNLNAVNTAKIEPNLIEPNIVQPPVEPNQVQSNVTDIKVLRKERKSKANSILSLCVKCEKSMEIYNQLNDFDLKHKLLQTIKEDYQKIQNIRNMDFSPLENLKTVYAYRVHNIKIFLD